MLACARHALSFGSLWWKKRITTLRQNSCRERRSSYARADSQAIYGTITEQPCIPAPESFERAADRIWYGVVPVCDASRTCSEQKAGCDPAGPPPPPAVGKALEQTPAQEKATQQEQHVRPQPGLGHRQRDRPVGHQPAGPTKDGSPGPNRFTGPQPQALSQMPQQSPARSTLQPQSAVQQSPYASKPSVPARHADFAENSPAQQKTMSTVQFWLTFHAEFGQKLRVIGSHKNLGLCPYFALIAAVMHNFVYKMLVHLASAISLMRL